MDCARAGKAIEDLGDGRVGRVRWMFLTRHVKDCPECGTYLERMSAVVEALSEMQRVSAPEDFAALVMARVVQGILGTGRAEGAVPERRSRNVVWVAAAGAGVAIAVALAIVRWVLGRERPEELAAALHA
jgi:predicted anti-sigma-YlaC factor YlaD